MKYHDESSVYSARRSRLTARRLVYTALIALALLVAYTGLALSQQLKLGDSLLMTSAFCANETDGRALLDAVQGGTTAGLEYMAKEDNTCALAQLPVTIGEIVHTKGDWSLLKVMTVYGEIYSVSQTKFFKLVDA